MRNGIFITFEGCEGCGKTTQARLLFKYLKKKGCDVVQTREPGGTRVSKTIRNFLLHSKSNITPLAELLIFEADRAQHVEEMIQPALEQGKIVICDRFYDATVAYQGYARNLDLGTIGKLNSIASRGLKPDITLLLDYNVKRGLKKAKNVSHTFDRLENERFAFHNKVREGYLKTADSDPKRIKVIHTQRMIDMTHKKIVEIVQGLLNRRKYGAHCKNQNNIKYDRLRGATSAGKKHNGAFSSCEVDKCRLTK
jgi:dTMP kinase